MGNDGTITWDQNEALQYHNKQRAMKSCQQLYWDIKLEQDALAWAEKIAGEDVMKHSTHQSENIAQFSNQPENPCEEATKMWFNEESVYVGGTLDQQADWTKVGHFTQAIWKDTNRIGIAHAVSSSGRTYVVAVYYPPGNYPNQLPYDQ